VRLAKMTSVQFSETSDFSFTKLTAVSVFSVRFLHSSVNAIFHLCLYGVTLEMTYFHAELVQLIVSQSDSELEVQRYGMNKNILSLFLLMLSCWKMNCE